jgi:serine/threonine protein kinase
LINPRKSWYVKPYLNIYLIKQIMSVAYELGVQIGQGSFGVVFRGVKLDTKALVAIKVLDMDTDEEE